MLSGYWPLMRYNPMLREEGKNPFLLDSKAPSIALKEYTYHEARYTMLARSNPEAAKILLREAQDDVERQWRCLLRPRCHGWPRCYPRNRTTGKTG